jgi:hypothetical protein
VPDFDICKAGTDAVVEIDGLQNGGQHDAAGGDAGQYEVVDVLGGENLLKVVSGERADTVFVDDDLAAPGGDVGVDSGARVVRGECFWRQ